MTTTTSELKETARAMIIGWMVAIIERHERHGLDGTDYRDCADILLDELEPVIFEYAPPPARILQALRHGNQSPAA